MPPAHSYTAAAFLYFCNTCYNILAAVRTTIENHSKNKKTPASLPAIMARSVVDFSSLRDCAWLEFRNSAVTSKPVESQLGLGKLREAGNFLSYIGHLSCVWPMPCSAFHVCSLSRPSKHPTQKLVTRTYRQTKCTKVPLRISVSIIP